MPNAARLPPQPLPRKAVMDLRQSTPHQGVRHQDSLRVPYALGARAPTGLARCGPRHP